MLLKAHNTVRTNSVRLPRVEAAIAEGLRGFAERVTSWAGASSFQSTCTAPISQSLFRYLLDRGGQVFYGLAEGDRHERSRTLEPAAVPEDTHSGKKCEKMPKATSSAYSTSPAEVLRNRFPVTSNSLGLLLSWSRIFSAGQASEQRQSATCSSDVFPAPWPASGRHSWKCHRART